MSHFKPGTRVYYVSGKYGSSSVNPLKGSNYECAGTISNIQGNLIGVDWDNSSHNTYGSADLLPVEDSNSSDPNLKFRIHKRFSKK